MHFRFWVHCAVTIAGSWCALAGAAVNAAEPASRTSNESLVFVGAYTDDASKGIYRFRLVEEGRADSAPLEPLGLAAETRNPSFLEIDPKRRLLFTVNEAADLNGQPGGAVSAYSIGDDGALTLINHQSTRGAGPCHLALDKAGRYILAANYGGGSVVVLPVAEDGRLGEATDFVQHEGSSVNQQRQEGPHAHFVATDPSNRFALVCDLGLDKVLVYRFDAQRGKLTPHDPPAAMLEPGAGPRHLAFHPAGKYVYVINELNSTITAFTFDDAAGSLAEFQTVSTLLPTFTGENTTAEIAVHPSGKFVYASNRGHDSIAAFTVDKASGELSFIDTFPTQGKTPRHFELDPQGKRLIVGNQNSDALLVCDVDGETGRLSRNRELIDCPNPACVKFLEAGEKPN